MNMLIKTVLLTAATTGVGTGAACGRQTSAPPVAASASTNALGPRIKFAVSEYDFGRAKAGEPVKYTYVFTNSGDQLLQLTGVHACGCITADWTKQVEPGKTGSIPIQFNTMGYSGPVFKQVSVTCNVTSQPTVFLQLKGMVYKPVDVIPALAVLNVSPDAEGASVVLTVTNNTEEPLVLTSVESNNPRFSAQLVTNHPGKGYSINVSTVPPLPTGSFQGQITLKTTWTNTPVIPVTAVANDQPVVMVIPSYITLPPAPLAVGVTNFVTIQNTSVSNLLTVSEPVVNAPGVEVDLKEKQAGRSFTAILGFPEGFRLPPGQQVELSLKTSHPKFPVVKVPVMQLPPPPAPIAPAPATPAAAPATGAPQASVDQQDTFRWGNYLPASDQRAPGAK